MRPVDADAARKAVIERWKKRREEYGIYFETGCEYGKNDDLEWLDSLPTIDAVPVVRCKDCIYYHKRHVLLDDGTEVDYDSEIVKEYLKSKRKDCLFDGYVGSDLGINVGGKCEYDKNNGYIEDKTVYRNEDDFCSKGKWKDGAE